MGLMARADALRILGRYPDSLPDFEAAAQAFLALDDEVGWARTRIGWVHAMHMLGRGEEALPVADRAREIFVRHGEWLRAGGIDINTAVVCHQLGRLDRALEVFDRALAAYEHLGAAAELPATRVRANKAHVLTQMGHFQAALALFDETRAVWVRHGQDVPLLRQELLVATVYLGQGRFTRALQLLTEIRAARDQAGHAVDAAWASLFMAEGYLGLNRNAEAASLAKDAVTRFEGCGTPTEAAKARLYASLALARLGEIPSALALLEEAAGAFERAGQAVQLGHVALQRARLYLQSEDVAEARAAADQARRLFGAQDLAVRRAEAETLAARAALGSGDSRAAAELARVALATSERSGAPWLAHEGHLVLARVARGEGLLAEALTECDLAVASVEQVQSRLAPELRSHFLDDKVQVFREAVETALSAGDPGLALTYLERAKSRALVDYVAAHAEVRLHTRRPASRGLFEELARLRDEHNWLYNRLHGYGLTTTAQQETKPPAEELSLREAVRVREGRIAQLLEQITLQEAGDVEGLAGATPPPVGAPSLDERTVLLEYFLNQESGVVFAVTGRDVVAVPLHVGAAEVQRLLLRWQLGLDACARALIEGRPLRSLQRSAVGLLQALYRALLAPVEAHLRGRQRIVVVPYGAGHAVPWHALHDGSDYVLQRAQVWTCPSSSLLGLLADRRSPAAGRAVVFANSKDGLLSQVRQEATDVARVLAGTVFAEGEATLEALRSAAPGCKVLHLAAHGEARLDDPTFAHLQFADGQLAAADVFNLSLDGALVTLSACETGRAVVTGGDELIGLSRGFLFAGASALVQSLWRVEDESTAQLMTRFYQALTDGRGAAEALRIAQLALLDERDGLPYFWAPFQVVGHGDWRLKPS
jgi:CHAT domain-containing protein